HAPDIGRNQPEGRINVAPSHQPIALVHESPPRIGQERIVAAQQEIAAQRRDLTALRAHASLENVVHSNTMVAPIARSGGTMICSMREANPMLPACKAASSATRSRTRNCKAASRAPSETSGGSAPKWPRNAVGSITLMSPRGVAAVTPFD